MYLLWSDPGDHLVTSAVVADGVAKRQMHIQRQRPGACADLPLLQPMSIIPLGKTVVETICRWIRRVARAIAVEIFNQCAIELTASRRQRNICCSHHKIPWAGCKLCNKPVKYGLTCIKLGSPFMRNTMVEHTNIPIHTLKVSCSNCSLRELCLPCGPQPRRNVAAGRRHPAVAPAQARRVFVPRRRAVQVGFAVRTGFSKPASAAMTAVSRSPAFICRASFWGWMASRPTPTAATASRWKTAKSANCRLRAWKAWAATSPVCNTIFPFDEPRNRARPIGDAAAGQYEG